MNNRFYLATEDIYAIAIILLDEKEFEQLDNACDDEFDVETKVFIDKEKKTFYFIDEESLVQANQIIKEKYKAIANPVTIKEITIWT